MADDVTTYPYPTPTFDPWPDPLSRFLVNPSMFSFNSAELAEICFGTEGVPGFVVDGRDQIVYLGFGQGALALHGLTGENWVTGPFNVRGGLTTPAIHLGVGTGIAPVSGTLRWNETEKCLQHYDGSYWRSYVVPGAAGGVSVSSLRATGSVTAALMSVSGSVGANSLSAAALTLTPATGPTPVAGMLRWNDSAKKFEGYDGTTWRALAFEV